MKNKKSLLAILTLLAVNTLFAQDYAVQVAAYSDPVSMDRFKDLPGTYLQPDHNNIYRYYLGPYVTEDFAEKVRRKALAAGFEFARVVNLTEIRELCKRSCSSPGDATFAVGEETPALESSRYIQHLFFDFDRSFLKPQSLAQLDGLKQILDENPSYRAELHGHTDAVGTEEYNVTLSRRRALKTKNYLVAQGISADRLDVQIYGKDRPIAKNFIKGRDSEEGRRLNRRVEIRIIAADGQIVWDLVEAISVPDYLKVE